MFVAIIKSDASIGSFRYTLPKIVIGDTPEACLDQINTLSFHESLGRKLEAIDKAKFSKKYIRNGEWEDNKSSIDVCGFANMYTIHDTNTIEMVSVGGRTIRLD